MTDFRPGRFQVLPTVVKNIIIINVIMVVAQYVLGTALHIDLADWLGLHYWGSHYFHWWQLVTHMFMHGSYNDVNATVMHIFFNMFALWMLGSILENVWGPKRFFIFYMVCGLGAALCHLAVIGYQFQTLEHAFSVYQTSPTPDHFNLFIQQHVNFPTTGLTGLRDYWISNPYCSNCAELSKTALNGYLHGIVDKNMIFHPGVFDEATVGASGAVFGVLFAFGYMFPDSVLLLFAIVPVKAKWFVAGYAIIELYSGIKNTAGDNVAHFAHLGGMLFAFILLRIWKKRNRNDYY